MFKLEGIRKLLLGVIYLMGNFIISALIIQMSNPENLLPALGGQATVATTVAAGLAVVVYGNIKEHQAKNGGSK